MCLLACGANTHAFKTCVQTFVTASFEVIVIVSFLCIGDQSSFVRSFVHFVLFVGGCSIMAEDTGKRKIDNGEAWERYVKRFRSNSEAAEQFIADEKLVGNEDQRRGFKKKRVNRMGLLRSKWAKLSRARKSEQTKESFQNFKLEIFYLM